MIVEKERSNHKPWVVVSSGRPARSQLLILSWLSIFAMSSSIAAAFQALIALFSPLRQNWAGGQEEQAVAMPTTTAIEEATVKNEVTAAANLRGNYGKCGDNSGNGGGDSG